MGAETGNEMPKFEQDARGLIETFTLLGKVGVMEVNILSNSLKDKDIDPEAVWELEYSVKGQRIYGEERNAQSFGRTNNDSSIVGLTPQGEAMHRLLQIRGTRERAVQMYENGEIEIVFIWTSDIKNNLDTTAWGLKENCWGFEEVTDTYGLVGYIQKKLSDLNPLRLRIEGVEDTDDDDDYYDVKKSTSHSGMSPTQVGMRVSIVFKD